MGSQTGSAEEYQPGDAVWRDRGQLQGQGATSGVPHHRKSLHVEVGQHVQNKARTTLEAGVGEHLERRLAETGQIEPNQAEMGLEGGPQPTPIANRAGAAVERHERGPAAHVGVGDDAAGSPQMLTRRITGVFRLQIRARRGPLGLGRGRERR